MANLYVFGIGGTGSRVLRSLTMLLASGVDTGGYDIVPIIIDPDCANGNLTQNVSLMDSYLSIREKLSFTQGNKNKFFSTKIEKILQNFTMPVDKTSNLKFHEFIDLSGMTDRANKAMTRMLFSDENLNSDMNIGFKGNPNIGSVVLNQLAKSPGFLKFAQSFQSGDKIFIISSIFGGTGASGFPLLLKTMRTDTTLPNSAAINSAEIGAITVLPYFKLERDDDSAIDSATFISKSKSALAYYERTIASSQQINALYFIGENDCNTYENTDGGSNQANKAHAIELFSATAVLDFARDDYSNGITFKELGINDVKGTVTSNSLYDGIADMIRRPMTQFALMASGMKYDFSFLKSKSLAKNTNLGLNEHFYSSVFVSQVRKFLEEYKLWLDEMRENVISLNLFDLDTSTSPYEIVTDVPAKKKWFSSNNWDAYRSSLDKADVNSSEAEDKFFEMYYSATEKICQEKFNF
jgi:hypothetical protein